LITLTTIRNEAITLNSDLILQIENVGDTMITCNNGNKIRVKESPSVIVEKILKWQQQRWIPMVHE
jgi:uncharacterized protein YlzI (FlbEa/FlbD family)